MSAPEQKPMVWPLERWPKGDQELWARGMHISDEFCVPYAARLKPATVENGRKAYGRFLAVLSQAGLLDHIECPAARLTVPHAKLFVRALLAAGNSHNTIYERMNGLRCALRVLEPASDFKWLIDGLDALNIERREIIAFDGQGLYKWGLDLMDRALASPDPEYRSIWYRNGLLICIMATLAPRLRALSSMRLGTQIIRMEDGSWELGFREGDIKTRRHMEYPLPQDLFARVDHYVRIERVELLAGKNNDWFWVGRFGDKFGSRGIEGMIRRASLERFGVAFGPHRFRHSLATTAAYRYPSNPGLAASILGVSAKVVAEHYNKARNSQAFQRFQAATRTSRGEPLEMLDEEADEDDDDLINQFLSADVR